MSAVKSREAARRKSERNIKYAATHTKRVVLNLNIKTDADILSYLSKTTNKQGLIKKLLRSHMEKEDNIETSEMNQ